MRAVFLDRDGVINQERTDYVKSWREFVFLPGVFDALRQLAQTDHLIIVVTNQAAIGRGLVDSATVEDIHRRMRAEVEGRGGRIDAVYYCPHHPDDSCDCRKPNPGLLLRAGRERGLDLPRSSIIGDALSDVQAGLAAGCAPIFVLTGRGLQQRRHVEDAYGENVPVARDLAEAVTLIMRNI